MNVTYLIGNGFDLGIGLKTGFKDFLKYYLTVESKDEDIIAFKRTIKKETIDLWADLELKFGEYIRNFNDGNISSYIKIYEDVLLNLNDYLKNETLKINTDIGYDNIAMFLNDILLFDTDRIGFRSTVYDIFTETKYYMDNIDVIYNFMIFNYTTTFEQVVNNIPELEDGILYTSKNSVFKRKINEIIHIHGQLDNNNMIFGVGNENQLNYLGHLSNKIKRRMIKPLKNNAMGNKIDKKGEEFIDKSDVICIYGMSIGATDSIWWERIGNWIVNEPSRCLIYFVYDSQINNNAVYGMDYILDAEEDYRNKFIEIAKIENENKELVKERIIVIINSNFMQMNLIKDEKEDKNEIKDEATV